MRLFLPLVLGLLVVIAAFAILAALVEPGPVETNATMAEEIRLNVELDRMTFECRYSTEERWTAGAREVQARIEAARECSSDAECTLETFGCPFECLSAVRSDAVVGLRDEVRRFRSDSCIHCSDSCQANAPGTRARCVERRCVVEAAEWRFVVPFEDLYVPVVEPSSRGSE